MTRGRARFAGLAVVACASLAAAVYVAPRFVVTTEITHFLPPGTDPTAGRVLRLLADAPSTRTLVVLLEGDTPEDGREAAVSLERRLRSRRAVEWVRSGPDTAFESTFDQLYFSRRLAFLMAATDEADLDAAATALRRRLGSPEGALVRRIAPLDPWLVSLDRGRAMSVQAGGPRIVDGAWTTNDGRAAVLLVRSRWSPFDRRTTSEVVAPIQSFARTVERNRVRVSLGGVAPIAAEAERAIRNDVERVSTISTVGMIVLFLVLFRSPRYIAVALLPLAVGMLASVAAVLAVMGEIHGITLAFGSSLVGVSIDYVEHLISQHTLRPAPRGPHATLRRVRSGLALGALTTIGGFAGLGLTSYPGIREIALFCTVGIAVAVLVTFIAVPGLLPFQGRPTRAHRALERLLSRAFARASRYRRGLLVLLLIALALVVGGLARVRFDDDVALLSSVPRHVLEVDENVRGRLGASGAPVLVAVTASDLESALARNDALAASLEDAKREGIVESVRTLHTYLWSRELQERNLARLRGSPDLPQRLRDAFTRNGFAPGAFDPFVQDFARATHAAPLTYDELSDSPLGPAVDGFVLRDERGFVVLTEARGVRDHEAFAARLRGFDDVHVIDRDALLRRAYGSFRTSVTKVVLAGLVAVLALCWLRYRRLRLALAAFAPAVLAAATTLAVLALAGVPINLLHVLGLLLVLSMGEDYGVFVVESRHEPDELGATLTSVVVAMTTTLLSFGLLAASEQPALRSIGIVTAIGVATSALFAPLGLVILGDRPEAKP